jgi:membrane-associated protein
VFDHFTQLVSDASGWAYGIVFALALLDAAVPILPSETAVIMAGVVAGTGDLNLVVIVSAAAAGAFLGDTSGYWIGRHFGARVVNRFFSGEKSRRRIAWAQRQLQERGGELIAIARFIPGGRTGVTLSAGLLRFSWHRFILFDAAAAVGWALYASLLGYFGRAASCTKKCASTLSASRTWIG